MPGHLEASLKVRPTRQLSTYTCNALGHCVYCTVAAALVHSALPRTLDSGLARKRAGLDRGVPTKEVLAEMRRRKPPVHYLVGTPKGAAQPPRAIARDRPWHSARAGVKVKLLLKDGELSCG